MLTVLKNEISDPGKQRGIDNQDNWICTDVWEGTTPLLAVIDGVGGYAGGKEAADFAKDAIVTYVENFKGEHKRVLLEAITHANNIIVNERKNNLQFSKMSCVLSAALIDTEQQVIYFGHLGDTRIYIFSKGVLTKITRDHSVVGYREEIGDLTEHEAMNHVQRNEILRVLGEQKHLIDDEHFIEMDSKALMADDMILLCSDGLTDMITKAEIIAILSQNISIEDMNIALVDAANEAGGKDNITVVLAKLESKVANKKISEAKEIEPIKREKIKKESFAMQAETNKDVAIPLQAKTTWTKQLAGILLGLLMGVGGLWLFQNKVLFMQKPIVKPVEMSKGEKDLLQAITQNDSLSITKDSIPATITLSKPIVISDTLFWLEKGSLTLVADSTNQEAALVLGKGALVVLQNITFKNFKVGIQTQSQGLNLKNVKTENVGVAIRNEINTLPYQQNYIKTTIDSLKKR